ncbi:suppressor of Mek1-like [Ruditapes philippinarum]|uniref:suppressor of Mek1-like n=1 Tax=Ruditapes philippinarum TaxID=129788 RepID=UPI00295C322A|nr:suppressor of Mek1-like [Ruditapes philippinarum]
MAQSMCRFENTEGGNKNAGRYRGLHYIKYYKCFYFICCYFLQVFLRLFPLAAEALFTTSKRSCRSETTVRKVDLTGEFGDEFDFTTGDESSQDVEIVPVNADGSKKKVNVDKQCDVGNKHMNKDDERDNENVDNNEYDCSEEHKEKRIEKRNDEPRRGVRKSPRTKKHSQDLTVDDDSEGRNIDDSKKSSVLENDCEELNKEDIFYAKALDLHMDKVTGDDLNSETCNGNLESSNDKDRLVTERNDDVDGNEVDGGAELSSNKTDKDNGKKSTATKSNHEDESEAKSDAKDSQDESEYLDAESFSPPDIFKIANEDNIPNEGKTVKDDGNKKMKSVVNMNDDRLTVSQDSCDSVYYDVEDEFEVKTVLRSGRQIRKETNLGIPQLEKSHMNSDVNRFDSNTKSSEQDSKDKNNKQIVDEDLQTCSSGKFVDTVVKCNTNNNTHVRNESSQISENAETQPPEAEICSNEVTSSGQLIEIVDDSENRNTLEESDAESDSFDEMLKGFIENKKATVINVEIADRSKKGNDDNDVMVTKKTPGKLNNKQSGKRKRENDKDETDCSREEKKRKLVEECRANIKVRKFFFG